MISGHSSLHSTKTDPKYIHQNTVQVVRPKTLRYENAFKSVALITV